MIEADEYDTAFFDKRSKFVHYRPRTLTINNLEFDHADIYADLVEWALEMHQEEKAREYLDTGLSVDPDNERLQKYSLSGATG